MPLRPLPPSYATTRDALHRLAVYVISPAQRLVNDEIVMRPTPGGFSTFPFDGRVIGVAGDQLVIDGSRQPIGSLNQAAAAVGIQPDVGQAEQFDVPPPATSTSSWPSTPRGDRARRVVRVRGDLLEELRRGPARRRPPPVQIWPEHFDIAVDSGDQDAGRRATYGASPGDRHHDEPYLYASPWAGRIDPFFGDPAFKGASRALPPNCRRRRPEGRRRRVLREGAGAGAQVAQGVTVLAVGADWPPELGGPDRRFRWAAGPSHRDDRGT